MLVNHGAEPFVVEPLARIAQLVIAPVARAELELVEELDDTVRGARRLRLDRRRRVFKLCSRPDCDLRRPQRPQGELVALAVVGA